MVLLITHTILLMNQYRHIMVHFFNGVCFLLLHSAYSL